MVEFIRPGPGVGSTWVKPWVSSPLLGRQFLQTVRRNTHVKMFGMCPFHHHSGHLHFHLHLTSHHSSSLLSPVYPFILRTWLPTASVHLVVWLMLPRAQPFSSSAHTCIAPLRFLYSTLMEVLSLFLGSGVHWPALSGFLPTLLRSQHGAMP